MNNNDEDMLPVLSIRFSGKSFDVHKVSIYDLGNTLISIQRIFNKAHLFFEDNLEKGNTPSRKERELLTLQLGKREEGSDIFELLPVVLSPTTCEYLISLSNFIVSSIGQYYIGSVLENFKKNKKDINQPFIGAIYADVVNVNNRINSPGGVEVIQFRSPHLPEDFNLITLDENSKKEINDLKSHFFLGKKMKIKGRVYRFYPNILMVTIKRAGGRKVNIFLNYTDFESIRYNKDFEEPIYEFYGCPRFRFGESQKIISEFEADSIQMLDADNLE